MRSSRLSRIGNRCRNWLVARRFVGGLAVAAGLATIVCSAELLRSYYVKERFAWYRHYSQEQKYGSLSVHLYLFRGTVGIFVMRQEKMDPREIKRFPDWSRRYPNFKRLEYDGNATSPWRPGGFGAPVRGNWFEWHGFEYYSVWDSLPSDRYPSTRTFVGMPLWFPTVLFAVCTSVLGTWRWRSHRRHRLGLCPRCGYDLRGSEDSGRCPECGTTVAVSPDAPSPKPA
jgi:hypothetical protein